MGAEDTGQSREQIRIRTLAVSRAGHDTGKLYAVLWEDQEYCYLSDGRLRPLGKPKKKKKKHLQRICHLDQSLTQALAEVRTDADVRRVLCAYKGSVE